MEPVYIPCSVRMMGHSALSKEKFITYAVSVAKHNIQKRDKARTRKLRWKDLVIEEL
jgi:hypothetical protein